MKKILVTGGCGFVGRHLIASLSQEKDAEIWAVDDLSTGKNPDSWEHPKIAELRRLKEGVSEFKIAGSQARIVFVNADWTVVAFTELGKIPSSKIGKLPAFDEAYHLASVVGGRNVIDNDPLAVGIDLAIDSAFFLWAAKIGRPKRILYASSSAAYPVYKQNVEAASALSEEMIDFGDVLGKPDYTYGWSKLSGEYLSRIAVEKYGLKVAVVRPFSGYGEDQEPVYPFPAIALRVAARKNPVFVWGDGRQSRDFIHIDDAVEACVRACRKISDGTAVNIGSGKATTFLELAALMVKAEGYQAQVRGLADRPVGVKARYCDPKKMRSVLDWKPAIPLSEGIKRSLDFAHLRLDRGVKPEE